ncbi:MAG: single-stranded DNA-binding protein [Bacillota bacterium]|nr:MAG: single-stranded DNA-binding protein [Bacillota bacterium]
MNKVLLIGNLTRDPELSETSGGVAVCHFSVAVTRDFASADGNRETDFFNVTVWRGRAETCGRYLKKGNKVAVMGSLQNRSYDDKDGIRRTVTEVIASDVEFLTPKNASGGESFAEEVVAVKKQRPQLEALDDDNDLPF